jgi:hypothetical protein
MKISALKRKEEPIASCSFGCPMQLTSFAACTHWPSIWALLFTHLASLLSKSNSASPPLRPRLVSLFMFLAVSHGRHAETRMLILMIRRRDGPPHFCTSIRNSHYRAQSSVHGNLWYLRGPLRPNRPCQQLRCFLGPAFSSRVLWIPLPCHWWCQPRRPLLFA